MVPGSDFSAKAKMTPASTNYIAYIEDGLG